MTVKDSIIQLYDYVCESKTKYVGGRGMTTGVKVNHNIIIQRYDYLCESKTKYVGV